MISRPTDGSSVVVDGRVLAAIEPATARIERAAPRFRLVKHRGTAITGRCRNSVGADGCKLPESIARSAGTDTDAAASRPPRGGSLENLLQNHAKARHGDNELDRPGELIIQDCGSCTPEQYCFCPRHLSHAAGKNHRRTRPGGGRSIFSATALSRVKRSAGRWFTWRKSRQPFPAPPRLPRR